MARKAVADRGGKTVLGFFVSWAALAQAWAATQCSPSDRSDDYTEEGLALASANARHLRRGWCLIHERPVFYVTDNGRSGLLCKVCGKHTDIG